MNRGMDRRLCALLPILLLAACGGGDSGTVKVTPGGGTPTPGASPGLGALKTGEIKPTAAATFISATLDMVTATGTASDLTGQSGGGTTRNRLTVLDTPGFAGSYDSRTGYRLADSINNATFGPAQLTSDTTASDPYYPTVLFTARGPAATDYLALYKKLVTVSSGAGTGSSTPRYGGIGGWQHSILNGGASQTRMNFFAFGPVTPISAMPRTGVVKFFLMGSGNFAGDSDLYFTSQGDTITVDFDAGTVSGAVSASGDNLFSGTRGGVYNFTFSGRIAGNSVTGATESTIAVASGRFRLLFIGPNADELIVTYVGQNGGGDYAGSSVGVRNAFLP